MMSNLRMRFFQMMVILRKQEPVSKGGQSVKYLESEPPSAIYAEHSCQTMSMPMLSIERFINDNECFMFYTGLTSSTDILHVMYSLGEAVFYLIYIYNQVQNSTIENQLALTLIELRQSKT